MTQHAKPARRTFKLSLTAHERSTCRMLRVRRVAVLGAAALGVALAAGFATAQGAGEGASGQADTTSMTAAVLLLVAIVFAGVIVVAFWRHLISGISAPNKSPGGRRVGL